MTHARRLAHSASFWLGMAYLALIPVFALAYDSLGHDSFYDSNSQREKGAYEDAAELRKSLTHALLNHLQHRGWRPLHSDLRVRLNPRYLDITAIEFTTKNDCSSKSAGCMRRQDRLRCSRAPFTSGSNQNSASHPQCSCVLAIRTHGWCPSPSASRRGVQMNIRSANASTHQSLWSSLQWPTPVRPRAASSPCREPPTTA